MIYFVFIAAFAVLLSDGLPPPQWNVLGRCARWLGMESRETALTLAFVAAHVGVLVAVAWWVRRRALSARDGTSEGDVRLEDRHALGANVLNTVLLIGMLSSFLGTGWLDLVRSRWTLERWPLAADLVAVAPFALGLVIAWTITYPVERAVRTITLSYYAQRTGLAPRPWSLGYYLAYRIRHQMLIVLAPMCLVLLAKFAVMQRRVELLRLVPRMPWAPDALVGVSAALVLLISPLLLRRLWVTRPLEPGPLRTRLEQLCRRVGLRYREILVWESQGLMVNAAVMGLFAPVRYVLLSDGLLATMSPRQIEAVFGHEAGHVRRHHLLYFGIFSILSMLVVGGVLELLARVFKLGRGSEATLQLVALGGMLAFWWFAFGFVSRKFERQADLYGANSVTDPSDACEPACLVHAPPAADAPSAAGPSASPPSRLTMLPYARRSAQPIGVCLSAARLFGRTLIDVAHFNGIPLDANSWRHGSIQSRCDLLERFTRDPELVRRFETSVRMIKIVMVVGTIIGCAIAAWLYWPFW